LKLPLNRDSVADTDAALYTILIEAPQLSIYKFVIVLSQAPKKPSILFGVVRS